MKIYKLICHIICFIQKCYYRLLYSKAIRIGKKVTWRKRFNLLIDKGAKIEIGDNCFFNSDCSLNSMGKITIGSDCLFGEGVKIYDHNHKFRNPNIPIKDQGFSVGTVSIGNHCWIGSNVVILKGASIGDDCVIGAGCIISSSILKNTIVRNYNEYQCEEIRS